MKWLLRRITPVEIWFILALAFVFFCAEAKAAVQKVDIIPVKAIATMSQTTVATSGTRVQLSTTSIYVKAIVIKANSGNTSSIFIGDNQVSTSSGLELNKGEYIAVELNDVSLIYVDADTSGDGVSWLAVR